MDDPSKPPDATHAPLADGDVVEGIWDRFRAGEVVPCPVDGSRMALSVDAAAGLYRFVCTGCGAASAWFEVTPTGLRLRGQMAPISLRGGASDE